MNLHQLYRRLLAAGMPEIEGLWRPELDFHSVTQFEPFWVLEGIRVKEPIVRALLNEWAGDWWLNGFPKLRAAVHALRWVRLVEHGLTVSQAPTVAEAVLIAVDAGKVGG